MNDRGASSREVDKEAERRITRRLWLQGMACTAVGVSAAGVSTADFSPGVVATAQASPLSDVIRAMSAVTGGRIEENWVGPTATLVGIILDSSKGLREIELGELEPPTDFLFS